MGCLANSWTRDLVADKHVQSRMQSLPFCNEDRAIHEACLDFEALRSKRNFIAHGSTYQMAKDDTQA
jgi:hypothetical protein